MKKEELMKKYHLDKSHATWNNVIDNWYSVEAYRQQVGVLPNSPNAPDEKQTIMDFLDNKELHLKLLKEKGMEFGSIFLSAKRLLYLILNNPIAEKREG